MLMETSGRKVIELNIEDVLPNRFQPRIKFNEDAIDELAKSIKEHGVIQPIVVRPIGDKFEIIAGERRYKASNIAGKTTIPAIITDLNDKDSAEVALIENVQRENLTPIEEAISYKKILDMGYITQDALASKLGKTQSTVANKLRLLNLDDEVQEALLNEKISERHARSLLKIQDKELQRQMLNKIISERLTVRRADEEIEKLLNGESITPQPEQINNQKEEISNSQEEVQEPTTFKFINIPEQPEEIKESEEQKEEKPQEELKPGKFFNILNEEKDEQPEEPFNFDNIFKNINETPEQNNNALLEELNEIENSINNSNTLPPIFNSEPQETEQESQNNTIETKEPEEPTKEEIDEFEEDLDFIDEEDFKEEAPKKPVLVDFPQQQKQQKMNNFKDVLQTIRNNSEEIENSGFEIETEEFDLGNFYQVIFKIKKDEK